MTRGGWRYTACCALTALLLLAAGCAADRVVGLQRRIASAAPQASAAPVCAFSLGSIGDQRDVQSLGQMGRTRIDGAGFDAWFRGGIASIPGYTLDAGAPAIQATVIKAYVQGLATLKSANLVVRVQFPPESQGADPATKTYRGFDDSVNWATSESEIQEAFNAALDRLVGQIGADLQKRCKPSSTALGLASQS